MTRWKAAGIHLSISILIGAIAFALLYFVLYPPPWFGAAGADELVLLLLGVDIALGPLLTLAVFVPAKRSLKFDLACIALLQLSALLYGLHIMWVARPVFIVAAVDRIELVYANSLEQSDLDKAEVTHLGRLPTFGPKYVDLRDSVGEETVAIVHSALSGRDKHLLPKYYVDWRVGTTEKLRLKAVSMKTVSERCDLTINELHEICASCFALPMAGRGRDYAALINPQSGKIVAVLPGSLW